MCLVLRGTVSANKKKNLENAQLVLSLYRENIIKLQTNIKRKEVLICYSVIHNFEVIGPRMDCVLLWHVCISAQHTQSYLGSLSSPFDHSHRCKIPLKKGLNNTKLIESNCAFVGRESGPQRPHPQPRGRKASTANLPVPDATAHPILAS